MITFKHKANSKRINIRTSKKLDDRMSAWLQKVFNIRNQIIGFKSSENTYYDVQTFYLLIQKFYNSQVQIVQGSDQFQISFTSDNLNSSSFIRPSQPNTSQLNPKALSEQEDFILINDKSTFQRNLSENKQVNILFDINPAFKKEIVDNINELTNFNSANKLNVYIFLNKNAPQKSVYSIYIGKSNIVTIPLTTEYKHVIHNVLSKSKTTFLSAQNPKTMKKHSQIQDEAPSFTTYHLQQRLNQQACLDYLNRMSRQKMLTSYQYYKVVQKLEDNFVQFYRIFCEGVMDNDYQSFKNEIRMKVQNNLQMLLSNVEEMDLSRPISREQQRKQPFKKFTPDIEIVKVQNYFEILDLIKDKIDNKYLGQIKKNLLDENDELCNHFSKFLARDIGKDQLAKRLIIFAKDRFEDLRPISRCVPRNTNRAKSSQHFQKGEFKSDFQDGLNFEKIDSKIQEPPMFGLSLSNQPESIFSPIKTMSDIDSNYKRAWQKLSKRSDEFSSEQYGLLYHFLQTKDDSISNLVQQFSNNEEGTLSSLRQFLQQRLKNIMNDNFNESQINWLETVRQNSNISYIYENFKYQCDISAFLSALKEEIMKNKPIQRSLTKKASDSQLLELNLIKFESKRKYSAEKQEQISPQLSPKASNTSLFLKGSQFSLYNLRLLASPWFQQFDQMMKYCKFEDKQKEEYLRNSYQQWNPSLFLWVRQFIENKKTNHFSSSYFRENIQRKQYDQINILKIVPIFSELMRQFEQQGKITYKMRHWAVFSFMELSLMLIAAFEVYILQKDQENFIQTLKMTFQLNNKEMEFYNMYSVRIQQLLKEMVVQDEASLEIFKYYPDSIKAFIQVYFFTANFEELAQNLDILQAKHIENSCINIASLNFSGINTNPFEYDDGSQLFQRLNQNMKELISLQKNDLKNWQVGKLDKDYQSTQRVSPSFNENLPTKDGHLLTKEQFVTLWRLQFEKDKERLKLKANEQQLTQCITMDHMFYRAIIKQVYQLQSFEQLNKKLKYLDPSKLNHFLHAKFNRPASKINIKQDMVVQYLLENKIDVLCLQQAGSVDWGEELIKEFAYKKNHDSVIIYRKEKIGQIRPDLMQRFAKSLDFNNDSAFIITNRNYLIISGHLKSKIIHLEQAKQMFVTLRSIKKEFPYLKVIIGMDSNHFIQEQNLFDDQNAGEKMFYKVPETIEKPTTIKKRTFLQAQYNKSGVTVSEVKDQIVSTSQIQEFQIQKIDGNVSQDQTIPSDVHPYDHYVVRAIIRFL